MKKREILGFPPSTLFVLSRVSFLFWSPLFSLSRLSFFILSRFFFPRSFFLCPGSLDVGLSFSLRAVDEGPPMFFFVVGIMQPCWFLFLFFLTEN